MYKFLTRNGTALAFGLGVLIVVVGLISIMGGLEEFNMMSEEDQSQTSIFNSGIWAAIVLTIACFVLAVLFGLFQVVSDPKGALKMIIGLVVIVGLVFAFYSTAEVETTGKIGRQIEDGVISATTSKWISGALATTLILFGATFLVFIGSEIRNVFK